MRDGAMKCLRYSLHFFHQLEVLLPGAQGHLGEEKHIILAVTPTTSLLITAIVQLT